MTHKHASYYLVAYLALSHFLPKQATAAQTVERIIAGAKKEGEMTFIAGAQTYGGRKGFNEIEAGMNRKYGVPVRVNFSAGPAMPAMAARVITELKAGKNSSADVYLGSQSHLALLTQEKALEKIDWSGIFPWLTKQMEATPGESVLSHTSINGIVYNTKLIPKEKAPKKYEDLVDPRLSATWAGKIAIPPYLAWLVELSFIWGEERTKDFARKIVAISAGQLRYNEEERIVSGEFPIMANFGGALEHMWKWQPKGAPLMALPGATPPVTSFFQLAVPRNSAHPNMATLFVAFMASKEGQAIQEKYEYQSSHLVEGTIMAKYVRDNGLKIREPAEGLRDYLKGEAEGLRLQKEFARIIKQ